MPRWGEHILLDHQQIQVILQFLSVLFLGLQKNHTVILWKRISQIITCHTKWCTNRKELRNRWCASVFNSHLLFIFSYTLLNLLRVSQLIFLWLILYLINNEAVWLSFSMRTQSILANVLGISEILWFIISCGPN